MCLNGVKIVKSKKTSIGTVMLYSTTNDMWQLVFYNNEDEIKRAKCFFFPHSSNRITSIQKQLARKEFHNWLEEIWKTKSLNIDDYKILDKIKA